MATRYYQLINPDGSASLARISGHQAGRQVLPPDAVELTEVEGQRALAQEDRRQRRRSQVAVRRELDATQDLQGWRRAAAETLLASGMSSTAVAAVTGFSVDRVDRGVGPGGDGKETDRA